MRLEGKVAVVTGSNGSIGAAIAQGFLREGAKVVLTEFRTKGAAEVARATGVSEENWMVQPLNAADRSSVDELIAATLKRFGRLDVFVAHAGSTRRKPFLELTDEDYDYIMNNNGKSVFMCSQAAAKAMVPTGGGSIIHTTSLTSIVARPNSVVYGASKGAILSMTRNMAYDLAGFNIRVNAICPGTILTNQNKDRLAIPSELEHALRLIPMKRVGKPEDVVGAAIYLASEESDYVTGFQIVIDGGWTAVR